MLNKRFIATTVAVLAVGVPSTALAKPGPLGLETAEETTSAPVVQTQDLRSPDSRDAAAGLSAVAVQDLRSPDARDSAASGSLAGTVTPPETTAVAVKTVAVDNGFEWGSAGIGAGAMLAIVLALVAAAALMPRHRGVRSPLAH